MKLAVLSCLLQATSGRRIIANLHSRQQNNATDQYPVLPSGVNFGGWLCLEDWFHSGDAGRFVSTDIERFPDGQGACLPPSAELLDERWPSEGILVRRLSTKYGEDRAAEIFMAHRRHFIGNDDLDAVKELGLQTIRVPMTWAAFPDALIDIDPATYGPDALNPDTDAKVVPDPFYKDTHAMVTIPRNWLRDFLGKCARKGLKVNLDLHAYPGGSSEGTFNGVWPEKPAMWRESPTFGNRAIRLRDVGVKVAQKLIHWVESLPELERSAVAGISPMNEPAHLSWGTADWGTHEDVLPWYAEVAGHFKNSQLPNQGVKLYVQLINTAFPNWGNDFIETIKPWYDGLFTAEEQQHWAVMDHHWYSAWTGQLCSGRTVSGGAYFCDDSPERIREIMHSEGCMGPWAQKFADNFPHLKAVSEFSIGTFHEAKHACTDKSSQNVFLDEQVKVWNSHGIEPFFWTWRMPYGPLFEPGWSLKYIAGKESPFHLPCQRPVTDRINDPEIATIDSGEHQIN